MKTTRIVIGAVVAVALAGGGFAAGMTYAQGQNVTTASASPSGAPGARGASGGRQGAGGAGAALGGAQPINGRVLAVNDGSLTVAVIERGQLGQGGASAGASPATTSQIVLVGASTRIVKTAETDVKLADIKPNDQVTIVGTTDSAGLVSASAVVVGGVNVLGQLLGSQTGVPGGARPGATPTSSPRP